MHKSIVLSCLFLFCATAVAQKSGGSSKPGTTSGSSSPKPSSVPKFGPTTPAPKPSPAPVVEAPKPSSVPKFGPTTPAPKPESPKFGPSNTPVVNTPSVVNSQKPTSGGSDKALVNKQEASRKKYEDQTKALDPPKPEYKSSTGKTVKVDSTSKATEVIRSKPSSYYEPEVRQTRTVNHIHTYHYSHDYGWYGSQPVMYVGGGYSSAFWWMMMTDWNAERRAMWLYNNQDRIERDAYVRGLQDARVASEIERIRASGVKPDKNYIDPEVNDDPSIMYDQDHIEATYNPHQRPEYQAPTGNSSGASGFFGFLKWVCIATVVIAVLVGLYFLVSIVKVSK